MTSVTDILVIAVILFASGISITLAVIMGHSVNTQLLAVPTLNETAPRAVITSADTALNYTDYIYLSLFIGFFIAILITGYFVGGVPIAAPIYFFVVILFTFVSIILQMAWKDIIASSSISIGATYLPITNFILGHLGYFMAIFGLAGILIMFAKPSQQVGL